MRGGKEEEKLVTPMFPRLHVNDTEKGGPRAPPRNKMALYEQLSVPSQRFVSKSASMLPPWADVPSTSTSHGMDPHLSLKSSVQLQNASEKRISGTGTIDISSREFMRNQAEEHSKVSQSNQEPVERPASIMSTRDKNLADASSASSTKLNESESFKTAQRNLNQESVAVQDKIVLRDDILVEPAKDKRCGKENASKLRRESCSLGGDNRSPIGLVNGSDCREDKRCGSVQVGDVDRHDDVSDTSMLYSMSALHISPDDVVGVIGEKQFWKARRAIVNQQKLFARQVFELHRLIKVQRLIAESPHLLLKDNLYLGKPSLKVKKYSPEPPSPPIVIAKDNSQKANPRTECAGESAVGKFLLPSVNNDTTKELVTQQSNYSGNPPPAPAANNTKPPPWCLHPPPGNQWLVPVMSPSDGLIYKPYTGPCPPTEGFMAPMYGNYGNAVAPFPMTPTVQASDQNVQTTEHRAQVIKVVPHNPRSATESAARICLLLQEQRKQL